MLNLYKQLGETPLERLNRFRVEHPEYANASLSYAGRLDPMAEGVLPVLVNEENKQRERYLNLPKEYEFTVLFGFESDTYDILGKVVRHSHYELDIARVRNEIIGYINKLPGTFLQTYPPYSSKPVDGEPLFMHARENRLDGIILPAKEVDIYSCELISLEYIMRSSLEEYVANSISKVRGDFRQADIKLAWAEAFKQNTAQEYLAASIYISCGSGVYVRSIAHMLGKFLNYPTLALHILRTQVGSYSLASVVR